LYPIICSSIVLKISSYYAVKYPLSLMCALNHIILYNIIATQLQIIL
jgi:hypothetical protein